MITMLWALVLLQIPDDVPTPVSMKDDKVSRAIDLKNQLRIYPFHRQDFYCYDENGLAVGLEMKPKAVIKFNQSLFDQINQLGGVTKLEKSPEEEPPSSPVPVRRFSPQVTDDMALQGEGKPAIIEFTDKESTLRALNEFPDKILPIVLWRGQECIPSNSSIILEAKSPIGINLIKRRLESFGLFNVNQIIKTALEIDGRQVVTYRVYVQDLVSPLNIFVLANLIAEDSAYFKWARPEFKFVCDPIQAKLYVTSRGIDSLGDKRFLHLDIHIFDEKIDLLKDLVPQLGEGEFIPEVSRISFEDIYFSADKPIITETKHDSERITSFVWPFIFLSVGDFYFKEIRIAYTEKEDKQLVEKSLPVAGGEFKIGSVLKGIKPPITDIQSKHDYVVNEQYFMPTASKAGEALMNWYLFRLLIILTSFSMALFLLYSYLFMPMLVSAKNQKGKQDIYLVNKKYWDNLVEAVNQNIDSDNWQQVYSNIESNLKIVLRRFFGLKLNVCSEDLTQDIDYFLVESILHELERVYCDDQPTKSDYECLAQYFKKFISQHSEKEAVNND